MKKRLREDKTIAVKLKTHFAIAFRRSQTELFIGKTLEEFLPMEIVGQVF